MHILVVSQYFWPENFRINDWVNGMLARGHTITVLTGKPNYPDGDVFEAYRNCTSDFDNYGEAKILRVPMISRGQSKWRLALNYISFFLSASFIGLWQLRKQKFNVIFVFGVSPILIVIPAVIYKKLSGTPIVLWVLDLWPESLRAVGIVKSQRILNFIAKCVSYLYKKCDVVLGQSLSFTRSIKKLVPTHPRIAYAPNWSEQASNSTGQVLDLNTQSNHDIFTILFTGNVGEAQDFPNIVNAAKKLIRSNIQIIIVGTGRKMAWLVNEVNVGNLSQIVKIMGAFPLEKMPSFYAAADACLVTLVADETIEKTIPGKLHAYMAYGKPIIGAINGEAADAILSAKCGYVSQSGDSEDLANCMLKLSQLAADGRKQMGLNASAYYAKEFERNKVLDIFEHHLIDVARHQS